MERLLVSASVLVTALICAGEAEPQEARRDIHSLSLGLEIRAASASTPLQAWTDGGLGKLRINDDGLALSTSRITFEYEGRLKASLWAHVVADSSGDASSGIDFTEAYLNWRPLPKSEQQHSFRIGAFYPPISLENSGPAWSSPYTVSFSAINTWLGEEIRPIAIEWRTRRKLGGANSPHTLSGFAAGFYGDDPAGTLLFWRGWSLHERQTRFNDRLTIPPLPTGLPFQSGNPFIQQDLEPISELDSTPGIYAGLEWTYASKLRMRVMRYDNRADVYAFKDGMWGWGTKFDAAGLQASLPARLGLIAQWMSGETDWVSGARPDGTVGGFSSVVIDKFDSAFILLTRNFNSDHRVSVRFDTFSMTRPGSPYFAESDDGRAQTIAYRYTGRGRISAAVEWQRIDSSRDLWIQAYGIPRDQEETLVQFELTLNFDM